MINAWWLCLIVPVSVWLGMGIMAIVSLSK